MKMCKSASLMFIVLMIVVGSNAENMEAKSSDANDNDVNKRQIMPVARVGRSLFGKRQSLIPAPRIGRRSSGKTTSANDCTAYPEQCENYNSGYRNNHNEELVEPLGIQLRAAFIPRLGKRNYQPSEPSTQDETDSEVDSQRVYKRIPPAARHHYALTMPKRYADMGELGEMVDDTEDDEDETMLTPEQQAIIRAIMLHNKRAMAYTPRIGRAVFAPRIGKKATFVPRIG